MISALEKEITFRYLKTRKKDGFLNVISIFSFIGISLGVAVLIIVMSVMNGFRNELINKIVGFNAHVIVDPYEKEIDKSKLNDNDLKLISKDLIFSSNGEAVLLNKDGLVNMYHKQQLVPMGEYVPFSDKIKALQKINLGQANFSNGIEDVVFEINNQKFSSMICFESTFPEVNRRHAKKGADFFVYLVNDGWYTTLPEPRQHTKQSIFRAIENRKTVFRCANTGISVVIAPSGEILQKINLNKEGVINSFITK